MATLKLTTLASVKAYWADIAAKHKQIAGYKWGDKDVVLNAGRTGLAKTFLWAQPFENFRYSGGSDSIIKHKPITIGVFTVPASKLFADEEAAYDFTEAIIEDIVSKLIMDKKGMMGTSDWEMIATNIATWKGAPVEHVISATRYIGCEFSMEYMDNTNFGYDPTKWNS
jgi:hypothetical protein